MTYLAGGHGLYYELLKQGFELPKECADIRLVAPVDGILQLHYEVNLVSDDLIKIGRALLALGGNND